jgi:hypothetical protein
LKGITLGGIYVEDFTIVIYIGENKPSWSLKKGKLYAVETNEDIVMLFDDGRITVWNDKGHLAEMSKGEYEIFGVNERKWFKELFNDDHEVTYR